MSTPLSGESTTGRLPGTSPVRMLSATTAWMRMSARVAAIPASLGVASGLYLAGKDISANQYPGQGLWRTSLWLASHHSMTGAIVGAGAGLFLAAWLIVRRPRGSAAQSAGQAAGADIAVAGVVEARLGLVFTLSAALALAVVLLPVGAPDLLGIPARWAFPAGIGIFWGIVSAFLVSRASDPSRVGQVPEGVWTAVVWLGYIVGFFHLWTRVEPGMWMMGLACAGLLAVVAVYAALQRPVMALAAAVGRRWGGGSQAGSLRRHLGRMATAALGVAVALSASSEAVWLHARGDTRASRPNLLIIAVDTLREDRVSVLSKPSSGWDLTPNLRERLSRHGTYFTRAYAQAPWTLPSFASILTGLYPEEHGAGDGGARLLPKRLTLAEVLRDSGYQTMAVVSGEYVTSGVGILQGFDIADESQVLAPDAATSKEVTDRALTLLASHQDQPFFLFLHYFDPHWLYVHHPEFGFAPSGIRGPVPYKLSLQANEYSTPEGLALVKALYAEEVAFTDLHVGRLLAYLDEHRLWDSTCVVFVADHGEEFMEHGGFEHGDTVFDELIHVPLFVAQPGRRGPAAAHDVVETRWLFGTVLDMLGISRPAPSAPLRAALSVSHGSASRPTRYSLLAPPREEYYARSSMYHGASCLIGRQYKLISGVQWRAPVQLLSLAGAQGPAAPSAAQMGQVDEAGRPEPRNRGQQATDHRFVLFDLLRDPHETHDLSRARPDLANHLGRTLKTLDEGLGKRRDAAPVPGLNRDQLRSLRALGYL